MFNYLLLSLTAFFIGLLAWRIGRRGRRIDDHPTCRKCAYDLTGLPAASDRCPECGVNIRAKHATRIGNHEPRPWLLRTGLVMALLALPAIGVTGYFWSKDFNTLPWLPLSWLEDRYKHGDLLAEDEIKSRIAHGKLSRAQATKLVQDMTAWQDDPAVKVIWGFDAITENRSELLHAGVDPAVIGEFEGHRFIIDAQWRKEVAAGSPLTVEITFDVHPLFLFDSLVGTEVENPRVQLTFDDCTIDLKTIKEVPLDERPESRNKMIVGTDAPEFWRHEKNGKIQGTLVAELETESHSTHVRRLIPFSIQVDAPGTATVKGNNSPAIDTQMAAAIHLQGGALNPAEVSIEDGKILLWVGYGSGRDLGLKFDPLPENAVFEAHFEQAGRSWPQGLISIAAGAPTMLCTFSPRIRRDNPDETPTRYFIHSMDFGGVVTLWDFPTDVRPDLPLELVLTSSPELAAAHSAFDHVWQGEIRIPVPIKSQVTTQAASSAPSPQTAPQSP